MANLKHLCQLVGFNTPITKIYLETSQCGRKLYESAGFTAMKDMMLLTYGK